VNPQRLTWTGSELAAIMLDSDLRLAGGPGSGNFGHAGRPGEVGGSASGGSTTFHGTSQKKLDSILKEGLRASYSGVIWPNQSKPGHVYMSTNMEEAQAWAIQTVDREFMFRKRGPDGTYSFDKGQPVVLEVTIPEDVQDRVTNDEHFPTEGEYAVRESNNRQFQGDIKPEWITGIWKGEVKGDDAKWIRTLSARTFYIPFVIPVDEPVTLGGKGSGNFGHKGRPGEVGGSSSDGATGSFKRSTVPVDMMAPIGDIKADSYASGFVQLYHVTDIDAAQSISKNGFDRHAKNQFQGFESARKAVYGWSSRDRARLEVQRAEEMSPGSAKDFAIVQFQVPKAEWNKLHADEDAGPVDWKQSYEEMSAAFEGDVPPRWINAVFVDHEAFKALGGKGSGNFGHKGRPGEVGGSADDGVSEPKLSPKAQREQEKLKQQELADKQTNPLAHPPVILGRPPLFGIEDYVAAYGEEFTPAPLPEDVERGPMGQCYRNATLLVLSRPDLDLDFAEGFAQSAGTGDLSFMHAWAVTKDGKVLDPTWDKPEGGKYFGVRYDRRAYLKGIEKRKYYGVIGASDKNAQKVIDTGGAKMRSKARDLGGPGSGNFGHAGRPGQVGGSSSDGDFARFESQVLGVLQTQSRTVGQFKDSGPVTEKPALAVEGKAVGDLADRNARKALRMVFDKKSLASPTDAEDFITQVNKQLTEGMLQPGQSQLRTWETPHKQTPPDQIEQGLKDFGEEFYNRMQQNDPVATAAWVEHQLDSRLHPFADAVGRTTKIISNWVLDRAGLPSPTYPSRGEYYSQIEKPLASWTDYYRSMLAPKTAEDADMAELTVLGRTGDVTYLDADLNVTTLEDAVWARVEYPDGEILTLRSLGGPGSGNFGHKGRPGEVGGSASSDEINTKPASTPGDLTKGKNETPEIAAILARPSSAYPKARSGPTMMAVDHSNDPDAAHDRPRGLDTLQEHTLPDGSITPERRELHEAIVEKMLYGHKPPSDAPVAHLMGGGGASGKSVMQSQLSLPEDQVHIDVDIIRTHLPEWDEELARAKAENRKADNYLGNYTHEEASVISKMVIDRASREGMNLMVDGAGDTSVDKVAQNVARYKVGGQKVIADYVTVDYDLAYQRMRDRGDRTGRYIPAAHLRAVHAEVARVFPAAVSRGLFDEFTLWDTSASTPGVNAKPAKIASGRGSDITIHDQEAWKKFLERGKGIAPRAGEI